MVSQVEFNPTVQTAYITIGLPASGKSTWAKEFQAKHASSQKPIYIVNNDTIRNSIYSLLGHRNWSRVIEKQVRETREGDIGYYFTEGADVIVDNTHMNHLTRKATIEYCKQVGFTVVVVDFRDVTAEECIRRDKLRTGISHVGEEVIQRMVAENQKVDKYQDRPPLPEWDPFAKLPDAIIVDIDGTMAERNGRFQHDESKVYNDNLRLHVIYTVKALMKDDKKLIITSGRSERCRVDTTRWLIEKAGFKENSFILLMRTAGDSRRDSAVKLELYQNNIAGKYNIFAVFDDRASVIRETWNVLNLPVFRCGVIDQDDF